MKSLTLEKIYEGLLMVNPEMKIKSIDRLKFKPRNGGSNELCDSNTIKITFEASRLPESISLWGVRRRILPYVSSVRKCLKCSRWGHSMRSCRGNIVCPRCALNHAERDCKNTIEKCANCGECHYAFDLVCKVFEQYKLINTVMAYLNENYLRARQIIKQYNIKNLNQVEGVCGFLAYDSWKTCDLYSLIAGEHGLSKNVIQRDQQDQRDNVLVLMEEDIERDNYTNNSIISCTSQTQHNKNISNNKSQFNRSLYFDRGLQYKSNSKLENVQEETNDLHTEGGMISVSQDDLSHSQYSPTNKNRQHRLIGNKPSRIDFTKNSRDGEIITDIYSILTIEKTGIIEKLGDLFNYFQQLRSIDL